LRIQDGDKIIGSLVDSPEMLGLCRKARLTTS